MNIILLQGGARKKGNTAKVLGWIEEELLTLGHKVETIYLSNKRLNGCLGCARCKKHPDEIACVQKDDMPEILEKLIDAHVVVFSSPLYFWGVNAQLKAVIDRTYSLYTQYHQPDHASLVKGQRQALLVTGGGGWDNNAEETFKAFSRLQKPHMSVHPTELYVGGCTTPDKLDGIVKDQAIEFAQTMVS